MNLTLQTIKLADPVAARSDAAVWRRLIAGLGGCKPAAGVDDRRLLGAFAKMWKATFSFVVVMSVLPSVHVKQLRSHRAHFHEIRYSVLFFENLARNLEFHLISEKKKKKKKKKKKNADCTRRLTYICDHIFLSSPYNKSQCTQKLYRKSKHILSSITCFPKIVSLMKQCGPTLYSRSDHRWQCGACE